MNKDNIINIAKEYLYSQQINFVGPGKLGNLKGNEQEVIFLDPQAIDPKVAIVEPEDIKVIVNIKTEQAALVEQM